MKLPQENNSLLTLKSIWELPESEIISEFLTSIDSPTFTDNQNKNFNWNLSIHRRLDTNLDNEYLSIFVVMENTLPERAKAKCILSLLTLNSQKVLLKETNYENIQKNKKTCFTFLDFCRKNILNDNAFNLIVNGNYKISCEFNVIFDTTDTNTQKTTNPVLDVSDLLNSSKYSDFTIKVGDVEIKTHKLVLSLRSPVFDAMFSNNVKETQSNIVEIKDSPIEAVNEMIKYMYTNTCPKINEMPMEIFKIADKYCINGLKEIAIETLCQTLSVENSCDYLAIADTYSIDKLKGLCLDFIISHASKVVKCDNWKHFISNYPLLLESLLKRALKME